jgi:hypothetical protein
MPGVMRRIKTLVLMPCPGDAANKNNVDIIIFIYYSYVVGIHIMASSP